MMSGRSIIGIGLIFMLAATCNAQQSPVITDSCCVKKIDSLVRYAKRCVGIPYEWGGDGPDSYDCSGFVCHVYAYVGVSLPRNSKLQSEAGVFKTRRTIKKGDLVFFVSGEPREISHVGIAITDYEDGNFKFIHANRKDGCVSVSQFNDPFFKNSYGGTRRIILCR